MSDVKLKGGPYDGVTLQAPRPLFELNIKLEPEDEDLTVNVNDLETHVYKVMDAAEAENVLTWCPPTAPTLTQETCSLKGGPLDGQSLPTPRPVFEVQVKFEPEDEDATVDVSSLETHLYRDMDALDDSNTLSWNENPGPPY